LKSQKGPYRNYKRSCALFPLELKAWITDTIKPNGAVCWICDQNSAMLSPRCASAIAEQCLHSIKASSASQAAPPASQQEKGRYNHCTNTGWETTAYAAVVQEGIWRLLWMIDGMWVSNVMLLKNIYWEESEGKW